MTQNSVTAEGVAKVKSLSRSRQKLIIANPIALKVDYRDLDHAKNSIIALPIALNSNYCAPDQTRSQSSRLRFAQDKSPQKPTIRLAVANSVEARKISDGEGLPKRAIVKRVFAGKLSARIDFLY